MRMRWLILPLRALKRFKVVLRDTSAVSAVEFALLAPALIAIPIPVLDIGLGLYAQMQVKEAAQAGAEYALIHSSYDASQIQAAATSATPLSLGSVNSSQSCGCPSGNSIVLGSCGTCPNGANSGTYVSVSVSATYTPPIAAPPVIQSSYALTSTSLLRIQ